MVTLVTCVVQQGKCMPKTLPKTMQIPIDGVSKALVYPSLTKRNEQMLIELYLGFISNAIILVGQHSLFFGHLS